MLQKALHIQTQKKQIISHFKIHIFKGQISLIETNAKFSLEIFVHFNTDELP